MSEPTRRGERGRIEDEAREAIRRNAARSPHGRAAVADFDRYPRDPHRDPVSIAELDYLLERTPGLADATPAERFALRDQGLQVRPR